MNDASLSRSVAVARYLMDTAVRDDDGADDFGISFQPRHGTVIGCRFPELTADELGRGEDMATRQMLRHLTERGRTGAWPERGAWF